MKVKRIIIAAAAVILLISLALPSMAMMYVDMPEKEQDPYNINPEEIWLTQSDIEFILEAWRLTNIERAKVGTKPLTLDWELCRVCKYRAIELTVNYEHERADGDENIWAIKPFFYIQSSKTSENIDNIPTGNRAAAITISNHMISKKGHKEALLGTDSYNRTAVILGCCNKTEIERTFTCMWFTTGYSGLDRYDPEKHNMPKYSKNFKISVVELDRRARLTPLI